MSATEEARRQAALAEQARKLGIPEWQLEMSRTVDDALMQDIVADAGRSNQPSSMIAKGPAPEPVKGTGWQADTPLAQPPGIDLIDRMVKVQDQINAAQKVQELSSLLAVSKRSETMK